ncbi:MAG: metal-dependent transcriptional regulator [Chloroflexota bacterium]|nr:metal-dependent transcriptional regulator [Chloroflexota bacterium]
MVSPNTLKIPLSALSESQQMYLVTIARQRTGSEPIPLSEVAEALSVSPVSVNEMCRRLQQQGLVVYQPYKGVSLTAEGERHARYVLRRHRLWEVFLVEKLGLDYGQAHDAACQLEHATPHLVTERLDAFLGHPSVNPKGDVIPTTNGSVPARTLMPLAALSVGQRAHLVSREVVQATEEFLDEGGLRPGASLMLLAATEDSLLVRIDDAHVSLQRTLAEGIRVEADEKKVEAEPEDTLSGSTSQREKTSYSLSRAKKRP